MLNIVPFNILLVVLIVLSQLLGNGGTTASFSKLFLNTI